MTVGGGDAKEFGPLDTFAALSNNNRPVALTACAEGADIHPEGKTAMIVMSMGKRLRLRRVFREGKALILPIDHPVYYGPLSGTENPAKLVALARDNGATAVLATAGALRAAIDEIGDLGIVMRVDAPVSHLGGPDSVRHLLHSVEDAAALGADMVIVNCYLGMGDTAVEAAMLGTMADVSAECERLGMPMCAEIIPHVPAADGSVPSPSSADLATAIRLGLEYNCDVVKTVYNGDPEGFARAVASGQLPVIMAGGPKTPTTSPSSDKPTRRCRTARAGSSSAGASGGATGPWPR